MGLTLTVEEAKSRTSYDFIQKAAQGQEPQVVTLKHGTAVFI